MCGCCFSSQKGNKDKHSDDHIIKKAYTDLGPMSFAEVAAGLMFVLVVLLWFFRSPGFIAGWAALFPPGYVGDSVPAILVACLLFLIPMQFPRWKTDDKASAKTILTWKSVNEKFPWSVIFLMGGGFALAEACEVSGLSHWIGEELGVFAALPDAAMLIIVCFLVAMLTEVTSNSATCTILMPIMSAMAETMGYNPLYLMFPVALSTSFAFMLPVATPPNAIAFSYGRLKVIDMAKAGALLNLIGVLIVTLATTTWADSYFQLKVLPWAVTTESMNVTFTTSDSTTLP